MESVDDIWASMKDNESERLSELRNRTKALKSKSNVSVVDLIKRSEAKAKKATASNVPQLDDPIKAMLGIDTTRKSSKKAAAAAAAATAASEVSDERKSPKSTSGEGDSEASAVLPTVKASEMLAKIARDLNLTGSDDVGERRSALLRVHKTLFEQHTMATADYNEVFRDTCKPVFKRYADTSEKCRELALKITLTFFERATDLVPVLGYFFPVLMQRLPAGLAYDEDMKIFVTDIEAHEEFRRGKAVDRQDRVGTAAGGGAAVLKVVEPSEEIRHLACRVLCTLLRRAVALGASSILHPYFHEAVMYLQMQLKDPFPDLKAEACTALELLARHDEFNSGMKFFAVALVRALLPALRHRHAKVRLAAVGALTACTVVPDRAKVKGSGTEAIADLVGFREENVLPIAAFYKSEVQLNYLAELITDTSVPVKEAVVRMLGEFMTEMGDRYDHQQRLLPYLLDLIADDSAAVSTPAMAVLRRCGQQYEDDHPNDIIEKRQYGIDGDDRINLDKPLPKPFTERPRIGVRLYVRGNTKRFLFALVNELTNWLSSTRLKSARLLKLVVALCEEHLTMEAHSLLPSFIKALSFAREDNDRELYFTLLEVYELLGRCAFCALFVVSPVCCLPAPPAHAVSTPVHPRTRIVLFVLFVVSAGTCTRRRTCTTSCRASAATPRWSPSARTPRRA